MHPPQLEDRRAVMTWPAGRRPSVLAVAGAACLMVLQAWAGAPAPAGEPTEQIRSRVERVYRLVRRTEARGPADQAAVREAMQSMFDWAEMARRSLGRRWDERTPDERAEFVRLFSALFEHAYLSRMELVEAGGFQYLGDDIRGNGAVVHTKVSTKNGSRIGVDYHAQRTEGGHWLIDDVIVDGASLIDDYRGQFERIIARSSYRELVTRLQRAYSRRVAD